jgi:hypothetical protein
MNEMSDANRRAMAEDYNTTAAALLGHAPFRVRKLSDRTIKALLDYGIDAPERLLFMTAEQLKGIPGVGKSSLAEIMKYRSRFLPE